MIEKLYPIPGVLAITMVFIIVAQLFGFLISIYVLALSLAMKLTTMIVFIAMNRRSVPRPPLCVGPSSCRPRCCPDTCCLPSFSMPTFRRPTCSIRKWISRFSLKNLLKACFCRKPKPDRSHWVIPFEYEIPMPPSCMLEGRTCLRHNYHNPSDKYNEPYVPWSCYASDFNDDTDEENPETTV